MAKRVRRYLRGLVRKDAIARRERQLVLILLFGLAILIALSALGYDATPATNVFVWILLRLLIGLGVAILVLPVALFLQRLGVGRTASGLVFVVLTLVLTLLAFVLLASYG